MRHLVRVLVAVTTCLTVVSPALAGPARRIAHDAVSDAAYVQQLLYRTSLDEFARVAAVGDRWFDWSTDWCSAPLVGSTGRSFDFRWPCRRHDFGYRNLRLLERRYGSGRTYWNATNRKQVDVQFLTDMRAHCHRRAAVLQPACLGWAVTFYAAVRVAGGP
jgi:hypothetical protein